MRIIFEATKKGAKNAALSAMAISRYIKYLKEIENELKKMLSEVTSSMKFLAMVLAPFIAGVTITMAAIMMMIFDMLGKSISGLQNLQGTSGLSSLNTLMIGGWGSMSSVIPIGIFQIVIGIYVIEVSYLLSMLSNGIENGPSDKISEKYITSRTLLISLIIYSISLAITYIVFGTPIKGLLGGAI